MEYKKFMDAVKKYGFSEDDAAQGGVSFLGSQRDLKAGVEHVEDDETPVGLAAGQFFYTGPGTAGVNNAIILLTDRRIIKADKKIKNVDFESFYIDDVNSSAVKTSFLSSRLTIKTTSGSISVDKVKKDTAIKFNKELHRLIKESKDSKKGGGTAALSSMDELKKAKELHDAGIIDDAEFAALKKKFLG